MTNYYILSVLVRPERTLSKYFSARWFNLLIFRKMMAEEFECGCYKDYVFSQGGSCKDGRGKVNVWEAGSKR